jgi:hypothetical protein
MMCHEVTALVNSAAADKDENVCLYRGTPASALCAIHLICMRPYLKCYHTPGRYNSVLIFVMVHANDVHEVTVLANSGC